MLFCADPTRVDSSGRKCFMQRVESSPASSKELNNLPGQATATSNKLFFGQSVPLYIFNHIFTLYNFLLRPLTKISQFIISVHTDFSQHIDFFKIFGLKKMYDTQNLEVDHCKNRNKEKLFQ